MLRSRDLSTTRGFDDLRKIRFFKLSTRLFNLNQTTICAEYFRSVENFRELDLENVEFSTQSFSLEIGCRLFISALSANSDCLNSWNPPGVREISSKFFSGPILAR